MLRTTGLFLIFAGLALGETQSGSVTSGSQPIPGATVVAICGNGNHDNNDRITTVTDDLGRFEMGGLPSTPCRFTVAMFGFEAPPREVTASVSPLTFDLNLQTRATLPPDPTAPAAATTEQAGAGRQGRRRPAPTDSTDTTANTTPSPTPQAANGPGRGGFGGPGRGGPGRGGFGRGGQAAQAAQAGNAPANQGFQSLSLQQNGENQIDSELGAGRSTGRRRWR
jgi:hypothetical protein